jgi:two-component sensor histidine kinase
MKLIDRLLGPYDASSSSIRYKARFFLHLIFTILVLMPVVMFYTIYIHLHDPLLDYSINWLIVSLLLAGYALLVGATVLLLRGHFFVSGHLILCLVLATIWSVMFIEPSNLISRIDTIVIVMGVLTIMPILILRKKYLVFVYVAANIVVLYIFMFYTRSIFELPGMSFYSYLGDGTISFLFIAVASYNILSINNRALDQHEVSNLALQKSNEELQRAMNSLAATSAEFEMQNRELVRSEAALRDSLDEKTVLIKEIHHRVKNNMQVISSMLNMQVDAFHEPRSRQAFKDAIGRIHSMASIHERMYRTDNYSRVDMAAYIDDLRRDLVDIHSDMKDSITVNSRMQPVFMGMDQAIPCGLLINEILTNSIKHGRSGTRQCVIDLFMEEKEGWITLVIGDNGPGMDPELFRAEQKTSMGMQIIEALAGQIKATLALEIDRGTRFTLRMPVHEKPQSAFARAI